MYDPNNIFAKIISGEIPAEKIYEDDFAIAINDINPAAPTHVLAIPKIGCVSFNDFISTASPEFIKGFYQAVQHICSMLGIEESGYRLVMNHGKNANQTVHHYHVHILAGKNLGPLVIGDRYHA